MVVLRRVLIYFKSQIQVDFLLKRMKILCQLNHPYLFRLYEETCRIPTLVYLHFTEVYVSGWFDAPRYRMVSCWTTCASYQLWASVQIRFVFHVGVTFLCIIFLRCTFALYKCVHCWNPIAGTKFCGFFVQNFDPLFS